MKKLIVKVLLLTIAVLAPVSAMARVSVHVSIPLPPAIIFPAPPEVVVIPETNVYAVPDIQDEIFFYSGWWWRPWEGRWYRSRYHDRGWAYYRGVPSFHRSIPPRWRDNYRERQWNGHAWEHQRVPNQELRRNWRQWDRDKHWERHNAWGVKGLRDDRRSPRTKPRPGYGKPQSEPPQGPAHGPVHPR